MSQQDCVNALWEAQGEDPSEEERELIELNAERAEPYAETDHVAPVYEVVLESGRLAYFKPLNGYQVAETALKRALTNYGHTPISTMIAECAAWQLAKNLGDPWKAMVSPTIIKAINLPGAGREVGSLCLFRPGRDETRDYFRAVPEQASAGAFFDCLIGQQDRNWGNVLWHEIRMKIFLIDHGFAFGAAGDKRGTQELQEWRWKYGEKPLESAESDALESLLDHDLFGLPAYLEGPRVEALKRRADQLLEGRELLFWRGSL
jgi:hypothetical protein